MHLTSEPLPFAGALRTLPSFIPLTCSEQHACSCVHARLANWHLQQACQNAERLACAGVSAPQGHAPHDPAWTRPHNAGLCSLTSCALATTIGPSRLLWRRSVCSRAQHTSRPQPQAQPPCQHWLRRQQRQQQQGRLSRQQQRQWGPRGPSTGGRLRRASRVSQLPMLAFADGLF